jgi:hypothetical protein
MTDLFDNQPTVFASSIIMLAYLMPDDRRNYFLEWLCIHAAQLKCKKDDTPWRLHNALENWFRSLSQWKALREYERVVSETVWWRNLADETLAGMLEL